MISLAKKLPLLCVITLLSACVDVSDLKRMLVEDAPVTSTNSFALRAVNAARLKSKASDLYDITGTLNDKVTSGSGRLTRSEVKEGVFEGMPALQQMVSTTEWLDSLGNHYNYASSGVFWFDANINRLGAEFDGEYSVVTSSKELPVTTQVPDTGALYVANLYTDSKKIKLYGTRTVTYVLEADTASTALLSFIIKVKNNDEVVTQTLIDQYRLFADGSLKPVKLTVVSASNNYVKTFK